MHVKAIAARTHGRFLVDIAERSRGTLVGFHGYGENADVQMEVLRRIAGGRPLGLVSIQGLHRFYSKSGDVLASWMTSQDREHAIADNVTYVAEVLAAVAGEFGLARPLVYVGFSQGVAMAYRAAALARPCDALIALAGDVPPDVAPVASALPRTLIGRGTGEHYYTAEKAGQDIDLLRAAGVAVTLAEFDGGHAWVPAFFDRSAAFVDELIGA